MGDSRKVYLRREEPPSLWAAPSCRLGSWRKGRSRVNNGWHLLCTPLLPDCGGNVTSPSSTITDSINSICNRTETFLSWVSCQVSGDRTWETANADFQESVTVPGFPSEASKSGKGSYKMYCLLFLPHQQNGWFNVMGEVFVCAHSLSWFTPLSLGPMYLSRTA